MLCGNKGKRRCDEERWICYTGDTAGSSFTIMGIDPSLALGMTISVSCHHAAFPHSSFRTEARMLCQNEGEPATWHGVMNLLSLWGYAVFLLTHYGSRSFACALDDAFRSLPFFFTTVIDPSLALGMTISVSCHYDAFPHSSFRTEARMLCGNKGKGLCDTEWWICYSDDSLPSSSSSQRILHIRSGWHFTVFFATAADSSLIYIMVPSALSVLWLLPFAKERGALKFKIFSPKLLTRKSSFAKIITIFKSADGKK